MAKYRHLFLTIAALAVLATIVAYGNNMIDQNKAAERARAERCSKPVAEHFRSPAQCFTRTDDSTVYGPRI